jgi:hypothetical protein
VVLARALSCRVKPLGRETSVDCMNHKDAGAKQTQDYRDHFNHLTALHYRVRLVVRTGFKIASSARRNGFVPTGTTINPAVWRPFLFRRNNFQKLTKPA